MSRLPPHSIEAEEAVLGSLLIDGAAIEKVTDFLHPEDFYLERGCEIFSACTALHQRGSAIDQLTIAEELNNRGRLEVVGGAAYLSHLIAICPTSLDIEDYAEIVSRHAAARQIIEVGAKIVEIGYDQNISINEATDRARTLLDTVRPARSRYLELSNLRIIKSRPPHYILNVCGEDMSLGVSELQNWGRFRTKVLAERDFIPIKPRNWDAMVNRLLSQATKLEAPVDVSPENEVMLSIKRWFDQRGEGTEYSDIQSGSFAVVPYRGQETSFEKRDFWAFQPTPLLRWLKRDLGKTVTRDSLWSMIYAWGGIKWQWRIGKEGSIPIRLWALPPDFAESAEFAMEKEERQEELEPEEGEEELPDI